tara:strand:- start:554 stop:946 length:393 start_codon:yes stop_codon:yes gene_type:complete
MAKIPKNAERFPIEWDSTVKGGENQGDSIPTTESIMWGSNSYSWGDVAFLQGIIDGIGTGSRRARQDKLDKLLKDKDKKKRLIHLICRIKGEKVYDDVTEVGSVEVKIEDVDMIIENIIGKVKLEIKSGI